MVEATSIDKLNLQYASEVERALEYWEGKDLDDIRCEMDQVTVVEDTYRWQSRMYEVLPTGDDIDTTETIVLGLPFLNDMAPRQYIRARTLQQIVNPRASVIVLPNNDHKDSSYRLNPDDRLRLMRGDTKVLGEIWISALERMESSRTLGEVSLTGFSQGGFTVLNMGAVGSDKLNVVSINADEVPSKSGRSARDLKKDFMAGGPLDVPKEARESGIEALAQAQSVPRFALDIMRFAVQAQRRDSKILQSAMSGSVNGILEEVLRQGVSVKVGGVEGSPIFDPESIEARDSGLRVVTYSGGRGHATGDNAIKHGLMAAHGIAT